MCRCYYLSFPWTFPCLFYLKSPAEEFRWVTKGLTYKRVSHVINDNFNLHRFFRLLLLQLLLLLLYMWSFRFFICAACALGNRSSNSSSGCTTNRTVAPSHTKNQRATSPTQKATYPTNRTEIAHFQLFLFFVLFFFLFFFGLLSLSHIVFSVLFFGCILFHAISLILLQLLRKFRFSLLCCCFLLQCH